MLKAATNTNHRILSIREQALSVEPHGACLYTWKTSLIEINSKARHASQ